MVEDGYQKTCFAQGCQDTTANRMVLHALIAGLQKVPLNAHVSVWSNQQFVINAFLENWINDWQKKNWHNVEHVDLWIEIISLVGCLEVEWIKAESKQLTKAKKLARTASKVDHAPMDEDLKRTYKM